MWLPGGCVVLGMGCSSECGGLGVLGSGNSRKGSKGAACPKVWVRCPKHICVVHLLLWNACRSFENCSCKVSNQNWTWWRSWILILCLYKLLSISSMHWVHSLWVCPISPHQLHNLCTLSYRHWIQKWDPSSILKLKPVITSNHGSTPYLNPHKPNVPKCSFLPINLFHNTHQLPHVLC